MKVYLDSCAIQRPLDNYSHIRIVLEAEAVLGILAHCDAGQVELVSSEVLEYEMEQCPWPVRQEHAKAVLAKACGVALVDAFAEERAKVFVELGVKPLDALHLALAEAASPHYLRTCTASFQLAVSSEYGKQDACGTYSTVCRHLSEVRK